MHTVRTFLAVAIGAATLCAQAERDQLVRSNVTWTFPEHARSPQLGSSVGWRAYFSSGLIDLQANLNRGVVFLLGTGPLMAVAPTKGQVQVGQMLDSRPNTFGAEVPLTGRVELKFGRWQWTSVGLWMRQSETLQTPLLRKIEDDLYVIDFEQSNHIRHSVVTLNALGVAWKSLNASVWMKGEIVKWGSESMSHRLQQRARPLLRLAWNQEQISLDAFAELRRIGFGSQFRDYGTWSVSGQIGLSAQRYYSLRLAHARDLSRVWGVSAFIEKTWKPTRHLRESDFSVWTNNTLPDENGVVNNQLAHIEISAGLSYRLGAGAPFPLRLVRMQVLQDQVFLSQRDYYASSPVATVEVQNTSDTYVEFHLSVHPKGGETLFQSETLRLGPDESKRIPVCLFLPTLQIDEPTRRLQLTVRVDGGRRQQALTSFPIFLHEEHHWDGNEVTLKYFVTPDHEKIRSYAASKLFEKTDRASGSASPLTRWKQLGQLITALGSSFRYIVDPTTSLAIDRVQYPVETLEKRSGDCEDLTVFLASTLMSIGTSCAVVSVRPILTRDQDRLGHTFLLVDTGIESEHAGELPLEDLHTVTRRSPIGRMTLWIPIEVTRIEEGFAASLHAGQNAYYREVTEQNGILEGTVRVVDL